MISVERKVETKEERPRSSLVKTDEGRDEGYDREMFVKDNQDLSDYFCGACNEIAREAVDTDCGHVFCEGCLQRWVQVRSGQRCPLHTHDENPVTYRPSGFLRRKVANLKVYCPLRRDGCSWTGTLKERLHDDFFNSKHQCPFQPIVCRLCQTTVCRKDLVHHEQGVCPFRELVCEFCEENVSAAELKLHQEERCPMADVPCSNNCGTTVQRRFVTEHRTGECPLEEVRCLYGGLGCTKSLKRRDQKDHEADLALHLLLVGSQMTKQAQEVHRLSGEVETLKEKLDECTERNQSLQKDLRQAQRLLRKSRMAIDLNVANWKDVKVDAYNYSKTVAVCGHHWRVNLVKRKGAEVWLYLHHDDGPLPVSVEYETFVLHSRTRDLVIRYGERVHTFTEDNGRGFRMGTLLQLGELGVYSTELDQISARVEWQIVASDHEQE